MKTVGLFFVALLSTSASLADDFSAGREAAERAEQRIIQQMSESQSQALRAGLTEMMQAMTDALADQGHTREASRLQKEWLKVREWLNGSREDLGDHEPVSKWLATTYRIVSNLLGAKRMAQLHLDDIYVINYALPVVMTPQNPWGGVEYALHFVPFAGTVVFWAGMGACMEALVGKRGAFIFCERVNTQLKRAAMAGPGPRLAAYVYAKFH